LARKKNVNLDIENNVRSFIWDAETLDLIRTVDLPKGIRQGWGLATRTVETKTGLVEQVYITDGTAHIYVVDPKTFEVQKTLTVKYFLWH
jgi:Glutamine cyclotransferase